jgi:hypothetical protein
MRQFIGSTLVGIVALPLVLYEWDAGWGAKPGLAVVVDTAVAYRSGQTIAGVRHVVNGKPVNATLRAWYCHLQPGQHIRVAYQPSDPKEVELDTYWQRHYSSTITLMVFAMCVIWEAFTFTARRRRQAIRLPREPIAELLTSVRDVPHLPIDTAPPLWDRELDGSIWV